MDPLLKLAEANPLTLALLSVLLMVYVLLKMHGSKLWPGGDRRRPDVIPAGNGNGSGKTAKLEALEMQWRTEVDVTLEKHRAALFEPGGAVRLGDHNVRNDVSALFLRETTAIGNKVDVLADQITDLKVELAKAGNCCEHCR
jgi:hypothetical protein